MQGRARRRAGPILGPSDPRPVLQSVTGHFRVLSPAWHLALLCSARRWPPMSPTTKPRAKATAIHSQNTPGPTSSPLDHLLLIGVPPRPVGPSSGHPTPMWQGLAAASSPPLPSVQADRLPAPFVSQVSRFN